MSSRELDLDKLVSLKAMKVMNEVAEQTHREQEQKLGELAARGLSRSGSTVKMVMNLGLRRVDSGVRAHYEAFKEVYASAGLLSADRLRNYGKEQAEHFKADPIISHINSNNTTMNMISADALERMVSHEIESLKARFLHDVEIDAVSLKVGHAPSNEIQQKGNLTMPKPKAGLSPSLPQERAIALLKQKLIEGEGLRNHARYDDERITQWDSSAANLLDASFGLLHGIRNEFEGCGSYSVSTSDMTDGDYQEQWLDHHKCRLAVLRSAIEQLQWHVPETSNATFDKQAPTTDVDRKTVFLVHGREEAAKQAVARSLEKIGLTVTILHEQADRGRTIIEKFEHHSKVPYAVILATADDVGYQKDDPNKKKPRARQNVILELGYFLGRLGRGNVFVLVEEGVEIPSDYSGVLYIPFTLAAQEWRLKLARELKNAGAEVDVSKLI